MEILYITVELRVPETSYWKYNMDIRLHLSEPNEPKNLFPKNIFHVKYFLLPDQERFATITHGLLEATKMVPGIISYRRTKICFYIFLNSVLTTPLAVLMMFLRCAIIPFCGILVHFPMTLKYLIVWNSVF